MVLQKFGIQPVPLYISIFFFESIGEIPAIDRHCRKSGEIFESHPGDSRPRESQGSGKDLALG